MTSDQRLLVKRLVDVARRELLAGRVCAYCGDDMEPGAPSKRYCRLACKKAAWYTSAEAKAKRNAAVRKRRARQRAVAA